MKIIMEKSIAMQLILIFFFVFSNFAFADEKRISPFELDVRIGYFGGGVRTIHVNGEKKPIGGKEKSHGVVSGSVGMELFYRFLGDIQIGVGMQEYIFEIKNPQRHNYSAIEYYDSQYAFFVPIYASLQIPVYRVVMPFTLLGYVSQDSAANLLRSLWFAKINYGYDITNHGVYWGIGTGLNIARIVLTIMFNIHNLGYNEFGCLNISAGYRFSL
jgi:hypothetical protein